MLSGRPLFPGDSQIDMLCRMYRYARLSSAWPCQPQRLIRARYLCTFHLTKSCISSLSSILEPLVRQQEQYGPAWRAWRTTPGALAARCKLPVGLVFPRSGRPRKRPTEFNLSCFSNATRRSLSETLPELQRDDLELTTVRCLILFVAVLAQPFQVPLRTCTF